MATRSKLWSRLKGDWQAAGDIYLREGQLERAAEMYVRAGNLKDAARLFFQAGLPEQGLEQLERAGEPLEAGDLLFAQALYREAVRYYERGGSYWRAAESAQRSNQPLRAAGLFERAGAFEQAARGFERCDAPEDALRCWEGESARLAAGQRTEERQRVDLHRAALLGKLRRFDEAAGLLESAGAAERAADWWLKARRPADALRCLLASGSTVRAAAVLEQATEVPMELRQRVLAASGRHRELGELLMAAGDLASAVIAFESAGEWARAAEVAESRGDLERAGDLYLRIEQPAEAARCFQEGSMPHRAAEAWLAAGQPRKAAGTFLEANQPLAAARAFIAAEDSESALRSLRAIEASAPEYDEATLLLAPYLVERGEAAHLLQRLGASFAPSDDERPWREREYWRGRALEASGHLEQAAAAYSSLLANQRSHRDAARRLLDLRARSEGALRVTPGAVAATQPIGQVSMPELLEERYEIGEELGRGGMSRVFRAFDRQRGERVALKILLSNLMAAGEAEQRLMNEFRICRRIEHPNVVRLFDFGRWRGTLYVTMELLEGVTLATLLDQGEKLPVDRVRLILADVLAGLEAAHEQQVVHRDLKPANVAVTPAAVKIMDFGIAYAQDSDLSVTRTGQVVGSPLYMSPEQIQGFELDARSDLYSLGVVAFTLLTGFEPFRGTTPTAVSLKHLQERPPDLAELRPDLDPSWKGFVERLLAKDREARFADAGEARSALLTLPVPPRVSQAGEAVEPAGRSASTS